MHQAPASASAVWIGSHADTMQSPSHWLSHWQCGGKSSCISLYTQVAGVAWCCLIHWSLLYWTSGCSVQQGFCTLIDMTDCSVNTNTLAVRSVAGLSDLDSQCHTHWIVCPPFTDATATSAVATNLHVTRYLLLTLPAWPDHPSWTGTELFRL